METLPVHRAREGGAGGCMTQECHPLHIHSRGMLECHTWCGNPFVPSQPSNNSLPHLCTRCDGQVATEGQHGWQVALALTQVPQQEGVLAQHQQQRRQEQQRLRGTICTRATQQPCIHTSAEAPVTQWQATMCPLLVPAQTVRPLASQYTVAGLHFAVCSISRLEQQL